MTQLYRLDTDAPTIAATFDADAGKDPWAGGYAAPGRPVPVIVQGRHEKRLVPRIWGVPPPSSFSSIPDPRDYRPVTTVRNLTSPFWIGNLRHTEFRCLIPVTRFATWSRHADPRTGRKAQHWFYLPAEPVFAIAGICRDSEVPSFAMLTCDANALVEEINPSYMPVILRGEDHDMWLRAEWDIAQRLVEPYPPEWMVRKVMNDAP
ncbi:SOS response-associated peptidase family protein [Sphingorhabdus sp. Alg239-R122]|uniref:SOS response-associated peptidase family protein n=1 Tax=Sphingorhabdus sp. Alg239-R122 TaxID=2305989 RepID=UPI0013DBA69A|nr:SOS response-associated peptidase family protein [Sphingorhabdus sp. Alg239-R122]